MLFFLLKTFKIFGFPVFDLGRIWWRIFKTRVVHTKYLDIYVFLIPPLFGKVPVPSQESDMPCIMCANDIYFAFLIGFWNCYESTACFVIHFIYLDILVNIRCKNQECTCMVCVNKNNGNIMSCFSIVCQQITTKRQRKCIDFKYISKYIVLIYTATMIK